MEKKQIRKKDEQKTRLTVSFTECEVKLCGVDQIKTDCSIQKNRRNT